MSPSARKPHRSAGGPRPSLPATVLRLASIALVAAALVWSALFVDLQDKSDAPVAALTQPPDQSSNPDDGWSQVLAPLTTRES